MKSITPSELESILAVCDVRLAAMILGAFRHGMRPSEVCGLRMDDIDLEHKRITVRRLKHSKTTVQPLSDREIAAIRAWLPFRRTDVPYVFTGRKKSKLSQNRFAALFKIAALRAGLSAEKAHPHCLKHGCANFLIRNGLDVVTVQVYLGHAQINSTMQYLKITEDEAGSQALAAFGG